MVLAYTDRLSVRPGEALTAMVSCPDDFEATVVRLPGGGRALAGGRHRGRVQETEPGSHVVVPDDPGLNPATGLTLCAWVHPTLPGEDEQGLVSKPGSYGLVLDERGHLCLVLGGDRALVGARALRPRESRRDSRSARADRSAAPPPTRSTARTPGSGRRRRRWCWPPRADVTATRTS